MEGRIQKGRIQREGYKNGREGIQNRREGYKGEVSGTEGEGGLQMRQGRGTKGTGGVLGVRDNAKWKTGEESKG